MKHIIKSISYVLFYFVLQGMLSTVFALASGLRTEVNVATFVNNNVLLIMAITNILSLTLIYFFRKLRKKTAVGIFNFKNMTLKNTILSAVMSFSISGLFYLITLDMQFEGAYILKVSMEYFSQNVPWLGTLMLLASTLVLQPITEEYLCRGVMFQELKNRFSNIATVLISAGVFGIIHILPGGIVLAVGAFIMGLVFGLIYVKTGSLTIACISHGIANLPDYLFTSFEGKPLNNLIIIGCVLVLLLVLSTYLLCKVKNKVDC